MWARVFLGLFNNSHVPLYAEPRFPQFLEYSTQAWMGIHFQSLGWFFPSMKPCASAPSFFMSGPFRWKRSPPVSLLPFLWGFKISPLPSPCIPCGWRALLLSPLHLPSGSCTVPLPEKFVVVVVRMEFLPSSNILIGSLCSFLQASAQSIAGLMVTVPPPHCVLPSPVPSQLRFDSTLLVSHYLTPVKRRYLSITSSPSVTLNHSSKSFSPRAPPYPPESRVF